MTLSTLVRKKSSMKWSLYWAAITAFCIIFAFIYEIFSHGVYSNAMIFMNIQAIACGKDTFNAGHIILIDNWSFGMRIHFNAAVIS